MTTLTTAAPTSTNSTASTTGRRVGRAVTVGVSAVATALTFVAIRAAGADFTITDPGSGKVPHTFVAPEIAMVTVVFGLVGWLTLAALERWTRRPHRIWAGLAGAVTALSLVPIWIEQATGATRAGLVVVHVIVAVTLLPLLRRGRTEN